MWRTSCLDAVLEVESHRLANSAEFVPVGGVARGQVGLAVSPRRGGVGPESAQSEGVGAKAAVDRVDEFSDRGGLLEHFGQDGHGPLGARFMQRMPACM